MAYPFPWWFLRTTLLSVFHFLDARTIFHFCKNDRDGFLKNFIFGFNRILKKMPNGCGESPRKIDRCTYTGESCSCLCGIHRRILLLFFRHVSGGFRGLPLTSFCDGGYPPRYACYIHPGNKKGHSPTWGKCPLVWKCPHRTTETIT